MALLIGNSTYQGCRLPQVPESLDAVEAGLKKAGFRVVRFENAGQQQTAEAIDQFARSVPTNGAVVFYYIGFAAHIERGGKWHNVLRPVGEQIGNDNDYRSRGIILEDMLGTFREESGGRTHVFFLDGCWDSPIRPASNNVAGGLRAMDVQVSAGSDEAVMFATGSAETLPIPSSPNASPLARALQQHLGGLDDSIRQTCDAMAEQLSQTAPGQTPRGQVWRVAPSQTGLGRPDPRVTLSKIEEGSQPGQVLVNSIGMTFRWCPAGEFTMGSPQFDAADNIADSHDRKPVAVKLTRGFWMGEHEVTQREYGVVTRRSVPLGFTKHKNAPFWGVSESKNVTDFCQKLNELERSAGRLPTDWEYTCPTEAEWEYACRAGSATAYCFGDSVAELGRFGNFADHSLLQSNPNCHWAERGVDDGIGESLAPVGSYQPNAWGLRDMHGNVAELVADHYLPELPGGTDPLVRVAKDGKTQIRGGAWCSEARYCESSFRNLVPGRDKHNFIGFRIVLKRVK